jgi:hypothetical protein
VNLICFHTEAIWQDLWTSSLNILLPTLQFNFTAINNNSRIHVKGKWLHEICQFIYLVVWVFQFSAVLTLAFLLSYCTSSNFMFPLHQECVIYFEQNLPVDPFCNHFLTGASQIIVVYLRGLSYKCCLYAIYQWNVQDFIEAPNFPLLFHKINEKNHHTVILQQKPEIIQNN